MRFALLLPVAFLLVAAGPPPEPPKSPDDMILVKRQVLVDAVNDLDRPAERRDGYVSRALTLLNIVNNTPAYHAPVPEVHETMPTPPVPPVPPAQK